MAFYTRLSTIEDVLKQMAGRLLDLFDLDSGDFERWNGFRKDLICLSGHITRDHISNTVNI